MGKTFNTGYLQNIIQYDGSNNIILPSLIGTGTRIVVAAANGTLSSQTASTTNIAEGTNLYYTDGRVGTYLSTNNYATQSYVTTAIANLVDSAPVTLDTLNELAAALGDDPNFATTVATSIGTKQAQLNGTGFVKVSGTTVSYDNSTYLTTSSAASTYQTILTNPVTGTGSIYEIPYWSSSSVIDGSQRFKFNPDGTFYVGPSNTAASGTAFGMDLNPVLIASANGDILSSLLVRGNFTNGSYTEIQNWLIIAEGSNNRWLRYNQYGLWSKQNDNTHVTALNLENAHGIGWGVGLNFTLGYGGTGSSVGTSIVGARIEALPDTSWTSTASTQDAKLQFSTAVNGVIGAALTLHSGKDVQFNGYSANGFVKTTGSNGMITIDTTSYQPLLTNPVTGTGGSTELAVFSGTSTVAGYSGLKYVDPQLIIGLSSAGNNIDYNLLIQRHGTSVSPGDASIVPALQVTDYAGNGYTTYQTVAIVDIQTPRISIGDANAGNTNLLRVANDDGTILHISGKGRVFVGQTSQTDNGQVFQVNGTSRFDGIGTFTSNLTVGGDFQLLGVNPRIDYPNGSSFRLYQAGVGTKFEVDGTNNFTFYGTGVDSPKISLRGLNYVNAMLGDTTTGTTDIGNLWLYNDNTLKIRLDADNGGTSFINSNKFVIGDVTSTNAVFRVKEGDTDETYLSKIQAVFGPIDYQDSDATNVWGGGTSETQFTNGNATRPAMISLGGNLNSAEGLGVINFFRSGNDNGYRSRAVIAGVVTDGGTVNQHGGYLSFRTAGNGDTNPIETVRITQFQNMELKYRETVGSRYGFIFSKEALHLTNNSYYSSGWFMATTGPASGIVADNDGSILIRVAASNTENNTTTWLLKTRTWGTDRTNFTVGTSTALAEAVNRGNITINGASNSILSFGAGDVLKGYLYNNGTDFIMNHGAGSYTFESNSATAMVISSGGGVGIRTTPGTLQLNVNGSTNGINFETAVTPASATTPYFTILESGVSRTVSGYNYETTQPLAMIITQTANTTLGLYRASEDAVGSTLRGMKSRGTAASPASVANNDICFSVEGYAWHGSGPNHPKLGGGMRFVKDDNWGTANAFAPMRTEFYNANSGTSSQTTMILYPSGLLTLPANTTSSKLNITSGGISKQHLVYSKTAAASGTATKLFYVGFNHAVRLYLYIQQDSSNIATATADFTTAYGSSNGGITQFARLGNISSISAFYDNGGSPAYTINVTVNYTGAAPTIFASLEGLSNDAMYLV